MGNICRGFKLSLIPRETLEIIIICIIVIVGALAIAFLLVESDFFGYLPKNFSDNLTLFCNNEQYSAIDSNLRNALCDT